MTETIQVWLARAADISGMLCVSRTAFAACRLVDPPTDALSDTLADVECALVEGWGVCVFGGDRMVGCLLIAHGGEAARLRRVSVLPNETRREIAKTVTGGAISPAMDAGLKWVEVPCRREFPKLADWWGKHGSGLLRENASGIVFDRGLSVAITVPIPDAMHVLGMELVGLLRVGDVIIVTGELGADKIILARGIGERLGVEGPVISPTFMLSRIHPSHGGGPDLVHVDAYRTTGADELANIDFDVTLPRPVAPVEWGEGIVERLSGERLEIDIDREIGDEVQRVTLTGTGPHWAGTLEALRRNP